MTAAIPAPATWNLPSGLEAAAAARRHARGWLTGWAPGAGDTIADACLAVSELAANAAEHGTPPVTLTLSAERRAAGVTVTAVVHDASPRMPQLFDADPGGERHRGLLLVQALAASWGVRDAADGGKDVWFEMVLLPCVPAPRNNSSCPERTVAAAARRASAGVVVYPAVRHDTARATARAAGGGAR